MWLPWLLARSRLRPKQAGDPESARHGDRDRRDPSWYRDLHSNKSRTCSQLSQATSKTPWLESNRTDFIAIVERRLFWENITPRLVENSIDNKEKKNGEDPKNKNIYKKSWMREQCDKLFEERTRFREYCPDV